VATLSFLRQVNQLPTTPLTGARTSSLLASAATRQARVLTGDGIWAILLLKMQNDSLASEPFFWACSIQ